MPVIGTVNFIGATDGKIVPVSVSRLQDGTYALIVDERSIHNVGVGGQAVISADASLGVPVTDSPPPGEHIVIDELVVSTGQPNLVVDFLEETTNLRLFRFFLTNNGAIAFVGNDRIKLPTVGKRLIMKTSALGNIACTVMWYHEP